MLRFLRQAQEPKQPKIRLSALPRQCAPSLPQLIFAVTFYHIKILLKLAKSFAVYRIVHPLTVAPCIYKTTFTKNFYMMRKCGLRYVKLFQNPARTKFTASQKPDYFKPVFIAQRPADFRSFFYSHKFTCFKNILIFINV